jgi:uncharacterized protein YndB with AHSA1/START domain
MSTEKITVEALIHADKKTVWNKYTSPEHITQWNFAHPSWHCPSASNDMVVGGKYNARMEARDGSLGFDFEAIYREINPENNFTYEFWGRLATITFTEQNTSTQLTITFDPETENPIDMQRDGWQAILNNFKQYAEGE